jgi:hypothetical protein
MAENLSKTAEATVNIVNVLIFVTPAHGVRLRALFRDVPNDPRVKLQNSRTGQIRDDPRRNFAAADCDPPPGRDSPQFRAPPVASIVRLSDDVSFQIIARGDEMMPAAVPSADGGAYGRVRPHQHDCARDSFSVARFIEKVLEDFDHPRFDPN